MGILVGFVVLVVLMSMSFLFQLIKSPFDIIKNLAYQYPLRTARLVVGFFTSLTIAIVFGLPFTIELSVFGGLTSLILGEIVWMSW